MKPNKETLQDLQTLFEFVSPNELKDTITTLLMNNLTVASKEDQIEKRDLENINLLFHFLDKQKNVQQF